ncbi:MAG: lipopolysaccharide heptosyltransferase II [Candidatus Omnitrophota bacterium]
MNKSYKRILIFNVNWLGDVIFSTAAIRNMRRNFPDSFIASVVPSRCYPILKDNPNLDEIIIFDERDRHKSLIEKIKFIKLLKRKKFDVAYLLHRSMTRALICFLAGIPERVGHISKKRGFLLTKKIKPPDESKMHRLDYYLDVIEKAGLHIKDRHSEFFFRDEDSKFAAEFLRKNIAEGNFVAALNAGGNWLPKRWPKENWAKLADKLIGELGVQVVFTGGPLDTQLIKEIESLMKNKPVVACGLFNLKQTGALLKNIDVFITADSGPLHIANAVGAKKIITIFGPTDPLVTAPYPLKNVILLQKDVGCKIPCYKVECPDSRCMKAVTPDEVFAQVKLIFGKR